MTLERCDEPHDEGKQPSGLTTSLESKGGQSAVPATFRAVRLRPAGQINSEVHLIARLRCMSRRMMLLNWDFQDDVRAFLDRGQWRLFAAGRLRRICPLEKRTPFDGADLATGEI